MTCRRVVESGAAFRKGGGSGPSLLRPTSGIPRSPPGCAATRVRVARGLRTSPPAISRRTVARSSMVARTRLHAGCAELDNQWLDDAGTHERDHGPRVGATRLLYE